MSNEYNLKDYDRYYKILQDSLSTVQSKDSTLDEVIEALENGVKAHEKLDKIILEAEKRIQSIIDERTDRR